MIVDKKKMAKMGRTV